MEHLAILEKIYDNFDDTFDTEKSIYIFAGAIYDTWSYGNELEKNLDFKFGSKLLWKI